MCLVFNSNLKHNIQTSTQDSKGQLFSGLRGRRCELGWTGGRKLEQAVGRLSTHAGSRNEVQPVFSKSRPLLVDGVAKVAEGREPTHRLNAVGFAERLLERESRCILTTNMTEGWSVQRDLGRGSHFLLRGSDTGGPRRAGWVAPLPDALRA